MNKIRTIKNGLFFSGGILIFTFLMIFKFDLPIFISTVSNNISLGFYVLISTLILLQLVIRSFRFKFLFNHMFKDKISLRESFILTGASFFIAMITPNKLGDTARGLFSKRKGIEITTITLIEYIFDTLILIVITLFGTICVYREHLATFLLTLMVMIIAMIILLSLPKYSKLRKPVERFNWYQKIAGRLEPIKLHFKVSVQSKFVLFTAFTSSCFLCATYSSVFYLVLNQLGAETSLTKALFATNTGMFVGAITFVPMGMGTRDISTYELLCSIGIDSGIAICSVIIMRSLLISLIIVCGLCYFLAISRLKNDCV